MQAKRSLGRSGLRVYFSGLELVDENLNDIDFGLKIENGKHLVSSEKLYLKHYSRLKNDMSLVWQADYNLLFSLVDVLPADYFVRFNNIREVTAKCPVDEQHFLEFLKKLHGLKFLYLQDSNLSQRFFDTLPEFCSLSDFYMEYADSESGGCKEKSEASGEEDEIQLNFNFMAKFAGLSYAMITKSLSLKSVRSFVLAFEHLRKTMNEAIGFKYRGEEFEIYRNRPDYDDDGRKIISERFNKYRLFVGEKQLLDNVNLDQVVEFFEIPKNLKSLEI